MAIARYLAMTADEFASAPSLPERIAWMACHFSPYSTSLSNLPEKLPENSLLILNDSTPPDHQDPKIVAKTLESIQKDYDYSGLLLDFQRSNCPQTSEIVKELIQLNINVCVSEYYAGDLDCPVFLPPPPFTVPLGDYTKPWQGREIWLDAALNCEQITVTEHASTFRTIQTAPECLLADKELHCHYHITKTDDAIVFTLQRTKEDLDDLLAEAESLGIVAAVGLYQELK